jgi:hypothetical protein
LRHSNHCMKKLLLSTLFLPFVGGAGLSGADPSTTNLADVRTGKWPISLERWIERRDTSYMLLFRDQQVMNAEVMDSLPFANLRQLRFLDQALTSLKKAGNGEIATFKEYSIKRTDKKFEGTTYLLRFQEGATEFQQPEADLLSATIRKL